MTQPKLLDRMREVLRLRQYSLDTEKAYLLWVRRFILFHGKELYWQYLFPSGNISEDPRALGARSPLDVQA